MRFSHVITFPADGTANTLWTDHIPLADLGRCHVRRASWIDWTEHTLQREVRFDPHADDPVFCAPSREACLAWEREHLNR